MHTCKIFIRGDIMRLITLEGRLCISCRKKVGFSSQASRFLYIQTDPKSARQVKVKDSNLNAEVHTYNTCIISSISISELVHVVHVHKYCNPIYILYKLFTYNSTTTVLHVDVDY